MQAYVWFLEAEPCKHPVIIKSWIGISGHLEIIGAFSGTRRCRPYGPSDLRQIALRLFWTSCYVFIYFILLRFVTVAFSPCCVFFIVIDCCDFTGDSRMLLPHFWASEACSQSFCLPWFGRSGGRAFNSAVMRIWC